MSFSKKLAVLTMACAIGAFVVPATSFGAEDAATSGTKAAGPGGPGGGRGGRMGGGGVVRAALGLTDLTAEQKTKLEGLQKEQADKMKEMRDKMTAGTPPSEADREKMKNSNKELKEKVEAILTADQKTKLEEALKSQAERRGGPGAGNKMEGGEKKDDGAKKE
ncbi:MAG: hypothetical protein K1X53_17165 [Candidatus Sumerlaeaceae bacterium]|nr:hypothetical protein [Candidatus Sumerlaeaceae bacterium]